MKAMLTPNFQKEETLECVYAALDKLQELEIEAYMDAGYASIVSHPAAKFCEFIGALGRMDLIIAIGGDGTIIHSAKFAVKHNLPLVGINVGRFGFLAQIEMGEMDKLRRLLTGSYTLQKRTMLEAVVHTDTEQISCVALNDISLTKGDLSRIVDIEVICNGRLVSEYHGDGVIFATPTGSTAYSLSAGGPVVDPCIDSICMTPICPHSLFSRSVLFSPEKVLQVRAKYINNQNDLYLSADGERPIKVKKDSCITIRKSNLSVNFIEFGEKEFYEILNLKLLERGPRNEV